MLAMLVHSSTALIPPSGNQWWKQSEHPAKKRSMCNLWLLRKKSATSASTLKRSRASGASWTHTHTHTNCICIRHLARRPKQPGAHSGRWFSWIITGWREKSWTSGPHLVVGAEEMILRCSLSPSASLLRTQTLTHLLALLCEPPIRGKGQRNRTGEGNLWGQTRSLHTDVHPNTRWRTEFGEAVARRCSAPVYGHFFLFCFFSFSFFSFKLEGWTHVRKSDKRAENRGETLKLKKKKKKKKKLSSCTSQWQPDNSPLNHENETMA